MKHSILLVDDEESTNFLHKLILKKSQLCEDVVAVDGAPDAMEYLKDNNPDVILLDINMPGLSGWDLLDNLPPLFQERKMPKIIMLTSSFDPKDREKAAVNDHVIGFLTKPLSIEMLQGVL